jgi:hypothetical protein
MRGSGDDNRRGGHIKTLEKFAAAMGKNLVIEIR